MNAPTTLRHGGDRVAEALRVHGVRALFTLCGGHISPILAGATSTGARDTLTATSIAEAGIVSPWVKGTASLTSAMTTRALSTAART